MLKEYKLKRWTIDEIEVLAICVYHNIANKHIESLLNKKSNTIYKARQRYGFTVQRKSKYNIKSVNTLSQFNTLPLIENLIADVRKEYPNNSYLDNIANLHTKPSVLQLSQKLDLKKNLVLGLPKIYVERHQVIKEARDHQFNILPLPPSSCSYNFEVIVNGHKVSYTTLIGNLNKIRAKNGIPLLDLLDL